MTRLGKFSKMIITGDVMQPDVKNSAFQKVVSLFDDEASQKKGIHAITFGKEDIFRNEILSFVIEKFESFKE
jgi:phosphate starvation-inducible protein PhoH